MSTNQRKSKNTNPPNDAKENLDHNNSTAQSVVEPKTDNKNDNLKTPCDFFQTMLLAMSLTRKN